MRKMPKETNMNSGLKIIRNSIFFNSTSTFEALPSIIQAGIRARRYENKRSNSMNKISTIALLLLLLPMSVKAEEIYLDCELINAPTQRMAMDKLFKKVPKDKKYIASELYKSRVEMLLYCFGTKWVIDTEAKTVKLVSDKEIVEFTNAQITDSDISGRYQWMKEPIHYTINIDRRFGTLTFTKNLSDKTIENWRKSHGIQLERSWVETQQCTSSVHTKF